MSESAKQQSSRTLFAATLVACLLPAGLAQAAMTFSSASVSGLTDTGVTSLNTHINSTSGVVYSATFDLGLTTAYGTTVGAGGLNNVPSNFVGTLSSDPVTGLACGTTYHYRINVVAAGVDVDHTFTTDACSIPTLSEWGTLILFTLLAAALVVSVRRARVGTPA